MINLSVAATNFTKQKPKHPPLFKPTKTNSTVAPSKSPETL